MEQGWKQFFGPAPSTIVTYADLNPEQVARQQILQWL